MITGQNGILNTARRAADETKRSELIEEARRAIIEQVTANRGKDVNKEQLHDILDEYFEGIPEVYADVDTKEENDAWANEFPKNFPTTGANGKLKPKEPYEDVENVTIYDIFEGEFGGGNFDTEKGVNTPRLEPQMIPVKWDEGTQKWVETTEEDEEWYNYKEKKWANAKTTKDGSMWVWIPRYAYQIETGWHSDTAGKINIKFLKGTSDEAEDGTTKWDNVTGEGKWNIHPAFKWGKNDTPISGIWVAKFEASHADATATSQGSSDVLKIQPSVVSWSSIGLVDAYNKCKAYNKDLNSHLIKNSEWGAVAYLTHSEYGLNGNEIGINACKQYITGAGPGPDGGTAPYEYSEADFESTYSYTTTNGQEASTTGNVYGIYDLRGGACETVAAYVKGCGNEDTANLDAAASGEPWTVELYEGTGEDNAGSKANYDANAGVYGDAIYENSSTSYDGNAETKTKAWFGNYQTYPAKWHPTFIRGGPMPEAPIPAGLFTVIWEKGDGDYDIGFRPVLIRL